MYQHPSYLDTLAESPSLLPGPNPITSSPTCVEIATQESHKAGDRLRALRAKKRLNNNTVANSTPPNAEEPEAHNNLAPDITNLATVDAIEHLLAIAEFLDNPTAMDLGDKPQTWCEA